MISIQDFSFTYKGEKKPALQDVCLTVPEGGFLGVIGPAGAGKTTLARAVSGMIPHHYTGDYYGRVSVNGLDTVETSQTDISRLVGMVFQDVESQIISPIVEDEILYGLENFGVPREEIPARMEEALERVGIADLRERTIGSLSGGSFVLCLLLFMGAATSSLVAYIPIVLGTAAIGAVLVQLLYLPLRKVLNR